ncbi:MAG TPA: four helix bundle protein [bacterium]|nr:four helix bundle protein [bacterium]
MFRFENLEIWKQAREFNLIIYGVTNTFPGSERFCLVDQLRRASISIVLNIAEGSNRGSDPDFVRFLRIAQSSLCEVVAGLYLAFDQGYLDKPKLDETNELAFILSKKADCDY